MKFGLFLETELPARQSMSARVESLVRQVRLTSAALNMLRLFGERALPAFR